MIRVRTGVGNYAEKDIGGLTTSLCVHPKYPSTKEIVHDHYFYDNSIRQVTYVGSYKLNMYESEPAYVIPIPQHVIEFNKGNMVDNETRPDREAFIRF